MKNNSTHDAITNNTNNCSLKVGIIGGGVAGSTIAIRLAALGVQTYLFENKPSLIDGPPMCHLHAGGNLYREIPDTDGVELLKQSIDILRMYPYSIDMRPTIIAVPKRDDGRPEDLIPRLQLLTNEYRKMIMADPENKVLGEADDYYRLYEREQVETLIKVNNHVNTIDLPTNMDDWVTAAALQLDLDKLKFPIVAVNEYGWNIFRLAASADKALKFYPNVQVLLNTKVIDVKPKQNKVDLQQWQVNYITKDNEDSSITVDYLINCCGFRTGTIDNMVGIAAQRMVEFKASYVTHWDVPDINHHIANTTATTEHKASNKLPEIIIHGKRGTPYGMVQLTPYPDGYFQIHSMNKAVTLFDDGLVSTSKNDAQPDLPPRYLNCIDQGWNQNTLYSRSHRAIEQVSEFVPRFASATPTNNALYGGQQIPGTNDTLRVADISLYPNQHYARAENVKASSALIAADDVVNQLNEQGLLNESQEQKTARHHHHWTYLQHTTKQDIDNIAIDLAKRRNFPLPMADVVTPYQT